MANPLAYLQEVNQELKKVTWPSQEKTISMTALVIGVSLALALLIAGADFLFEQMLELIIR